MSAILARRGIEEKCPRTCPRFCLRYAGNPVFDVARIIDARRPAIFVLENVKNLKSHDGGKTFRIIMQTLDELGYDVADSQDMGADDPKIIDGNTSCPSTGNVLCWSGSAAIST